MCSISSVGLVDRLRNAARVQKEKRLGAVRLPGKLGRVYMRWYRNRTFRKHYEKHSENSPPESLFSCRSSISSSTSTSSASVSPSTPASDVFDNHLDVLSEWHALDVDSPRWVTMPVYAKTPPATLTDPFGSKYLTGRLMGKGGFALCYHAERLENERPTGKFVAVKVVKNQVEPKIIAQKFVTELQIHSKLLHPNIVTFYRAFSTYANTYVIMELCSNGSLADMLKKRQCLTLPEIRRMMIQVCGAVKYLHERHIVHRDLKTGNLFLDENMDIKVGDFGLSALLITKKDREVQRRTTMCGTPNYLAPEVLDKENGHDERVDLWSIGIITYTLAVGKAPFHAATKELIYTKLMNGVYSWPDLETTPTAASSCTGLRDLVSMLLVPEKDRPNPDQIASSYFFRMSEIPDTLDKSCTERAPQPVAPSIPSNQDIQRGYTQSWRQACQKAGVGEYAPGKCWSINTGYRTRSIVHDIAREVESGQLPTIPIPLDSMYVSGINDWDGLSSSEGDSPRRIQEIPPNRAPRQNPPSSVPDSYTSRDSKLMPPPAKLPAARMPKSGLTRRAGRTISEESAKAPTTFKIAEDIPAPIVISKRNNPLTAAPVAAVRNTNSASTTGTVGAPPKTSIDSMSGKPTRSRTTTKRTADPALAKRRNHGVRFNSRSEPGPVATLDELKHVSPHRTVKKTTTPREVVDILSDSDHNLDHNPLHQHIPPSRSRRTAGAPTSSDPDSLPHTNPSAVVKRLTRFRNNLVDALDDVSRLRCNPGEADRLPFVTRWVDYSRKHGFGYVLADGTVGCVINASTKNKTPVTHVLVRDGQNFLTQIGDNFERVDDLPLEIYEDCGDRDLQRKISIDQGSDRKSSHHIDTARRHTLAVLWAKFGRYMCQSQDVGATSPGSNSTNFVRFYQRVGTVGVWAFTDGSLQVHFPDHTKLVISSSGTLVSATCISPEAMLHLADKGVLQPQHLARREVVADGIAAILNDYDGIPARWIETNAIRDKLTWVTALVDQWIVNGGLGRLNDDDEDNGRKLTWHGLRVADMEKRKDWVTVGRCGGD